MTGRLGHLAVIVAVIVVAILGNTLVDRAPRLSVTREGDTQVLAAAARSLTGVRHAAAVAYVTDTGSRVGYLGSQPWTDYEFGSITKTFTAHLLADSVARGEVRADTRLGDLLDLGDSGAASIRLDELATYRSGLGEWGDDRRDGGIERWWVESVQGGTVHDIAMPELLARARADSLSTRGQFSYSNIGFALLGHALAAAARVSFEELLDDRLLGPLAMTETAVADDLDLNRPKGYRSDGRRSPAWILGAYAPSGGAHGTIGDLATYARALVDGRAPGMAAMEPRSTGSDGRGTGWGWYVRTVDGRSVVWKTGTTGGYATFIAVDSARRDAIVVVTDTATGVEDAAWQMLDDLRRDARA